jgi:GNAT superfamily N-acetyltransferase
MERRRIGSRPLKWPHRTQGAHTVQWLASTDNVDWQELSNLYLAAGMSPKSPADLATVFGNSRFCALVVDDDKLVGAGRVLADGVDCAYVCDVAVLPAYQGRGLGAAILQRLVDASKGHRKIILYAVPGKERFYERFGFRRMRTAMAIFRNQDAAAERGLVWGVNGQ